MFRKGQWVKVDGKVGIVVVPSGGALVSPNGRFNVLGEEGKLLDFVPGDSCLVQMVDKDGGNLMMPDAVRQIFVPVHGLVPNTKITAIISREDIPAKRLATMDPSWTPKA